MVYNLYNKKAQNMQIKVFDSFHPEHSKLYQEIFELTKPVTQNYPGYAEWFQKTFMLGLYKKERLYIVAQDLNNQLLGCALVKKTPQEEKLCTLFVDKKYRRCGIGRQLLAQTIKVLGKRPLISVSDQSMPQMQPLLDEFGFHLSSQKKDVYRPNHTEFYFNDTRADAIQKGLIPLLIQRQKQLKR